MNRILYASLLAFITLTACKGKEDKKAETYTPSTEAAEPQSKDIVVTGDLVFVTMTGNDQMIYNVNEIRVKSNQTIKLSLKNIGTLPAESMSHNFVLLKKDVSPAAFAMEAVKGVDENYLPAAMLSRTIAHTKMLGPGQSDSIEFKAPAPGTYDYICTFPGHFSVMKGKLIVE